MMTVPDCTAPIRGEGHYGCMDNQIRTAAETTAAIVVQAIKAHTSLCIPGATDVRPIVPITPPASRVVDVKGTDGAPTTA